MSPLQCDGWVAVTRPNERRRPSCFPVRRFLTIIAIFGPTKRISIRKSRGWGILPALFLSKPSSSLYFVFVFPAFGAYSYACSRRNNGSWLCIHFHAGEDPIFPWQEHRTIRSCDCARKLFLRAGGPPANSDSTTIATGPLLCTTYRSMMVPASHCGAGYHDCKWLMRIFLRATRANRCLRGNFLLSTNEIRSQI